MSLAKKELIAFYGTLKKDSANPFVGELSKKLSYIGGCYIKGDLYDLGRLPAFKLGDGKVQAELYEVIDKSILLKLDEYEAIDNINRKNPGYRRVLANLVSSQSKVWVYEYRGQPKPGQLIKSGIWPSDRNLRVILAIRTDTQQAELYLMTLDGQKIDNYIWGAGISLADELLPSIHKLFNRNEVNILDLAGIIVFTGEGSFTGLRIGTTVANTLAYSCNIPVLESTGDKWLIDGVNLFDYKKPGDYVIPKYSSEPNITKPKNP